MLKVKKYSLVTERWGRARNYSNCPLGNCWPHLFSDNSWQSGWHQLLRTLFVTILKDTLQTHMHAHLLKHICFHIALLGLYRQVAYMHHQPPQHENHHPVTGHHHRAGSAPRGQVYEGVMNLTSGFSVLVSPPQFSVAWTDRNFLISDTSHSPKMYEVRMILVILNCLWVGMLVRLYVLDQWQTGNLSRGTAGIGYPLPWWPWFG